MVTKEFDFEFSRVVGAVYSTEENAAMAKSVKLNEYLIRTRKVFRSNMQIGVFDFDNFKPERKRIFLDNLSNKILDPVDLGDVDFVKIFVNFETDNLNFSVRNYGKEFFPFLSCNLKLIDIVLEFHYSNSQSPKLTRVNPDTLTNPLRSIYNNVVSFPISFSLVDARYTMIPSLRGSEILSEEETTIKNALYEAIMKRIGSVSTTAGNVKIYQTPFTSVERGKTNYYKISNLTNYLIEFVTSCNEVKEEDKEDIYEIDVKGFQVSEGFLVEVMNGLGQKVLTKIPLETLSETKETISVLWNPEDTNIETVELPLSLFKEEIYRYIKREIRISHDMLGIEQNEFKVIDSKEGIEPNVEKLPDITSLKVPLYERINLMSESQVELEFIVACINDKEKAIWFSKMLDGKLTFQLCKENGGKKEVVFKTRASSVLVNFWAKKKYISVTFLAPSRLEEVIKEAYSSVNLNLIYDDGLIVGSSGLEFNYTGTKI